MVFLLMTIREKWSCRISAQYQTNDAQHKQNTKQQSSLSRVFVRQFVHLLSCARCAVLLFLGDTESAVAWIVAPNSVISASSALLGNIACFQVSPVFDQCHPQPGREGVGSGFIAQRTTNLIWNSGNRILHLIDVLTGCALFFEER